MLRAIQRIVSIFLKKPNSHDSNILTLNNSTQSNFNFICYGHINGSYSLAAFNRAYFKALSTSIYDIYVQPVEGKKTNRFNDVPEQDKQWIEKRLVSKNKIPPTSVKIFAHYPLLIPENNEGLNLALFFWEESIIPESIIKTLNTHYDGILVATNFVKKVLIDSGFKKTIAVIGSGLSFIPQRPNDFCTENNTFTFLHVSSCFPRKGVDVLLDAYTKAFTSKDNVKLVIKTFPNPHHNIQKSINDILGSHPEAPRIELINEIISENELSLLYCNASAIVLPTRGEGLNLPAAESMISKKPLILTAHPAHLDFCDKENSLLIDYQFTASNSHCKSNDSLWTEPNIEHLSTTMRELFLNWLNRDQNLIESKISKAYIQATRFFDWSNVAKKTFIACDKIKQSKFNSTQINLGWLSTWNSECGIAEYSAFILKEFNNGNLNINIYSLSNTKNFSTNKGFNVSNCKKISKRAKNMKTFIDKLIHDKINILVLQYHSAFFSISIFSSFIEHLNKAKIKIVFVFHTIKVLSSLDQSVILQLKLCDRILVHTVEDLNLLKFHGLTHNTTYFPHGVINQFNDNTATHISPSTTNYNNIVLGSYGFFFNHKGIFQLISAFKELLKSIPNARLILINAEYPNRYSKDEINRCIAHAKELNVFHLIEWHTDFKSNSESLSLIKRCDIMLLPYQNTDESSSAAVRMALASGKFVLTTPLPIFNDVKNVTYQIKGVEAKDITEGVLNFLNEPQQLHHEISIKQKQWLIDNDWKKLSARMQGMIQGLVINE